MKPTHGNTSTSKQVAKAVALAATAHKLMAGNKK